MTHIHIEEIDVKKTLTAMLLILAIPTAFAGGDWKAHSERRLERMAQELQLTEAQKASVRSVMEAQWAKHKALHEETRTRIAGVLTPEQATKLDKMHEERKARWKEHHTSHHDCTDKAAN